MTWTVINNSDVDADSPITTGLMTALRDNVASAFAKDSGAPVLANDYIVAAMIPDSEITGDKLNDMTAGTEVISYYHGQIPTTVAHSSYNKVFQCRSGQTGTVRVGWENPNTSMYGRVYKNGVAISGEFTGAGAKTYDLSVVEGDLIQIYGNWSTNGYQTGDDIKDPWIGVTNGVGIVGAWEVS